MYHSANQLSNSRLFPWECYDIAYKTILFIVWNDYIYAILPVHISKVIHACFHTEEISERTMAALFFIILQCKLKIVSTKESYQILLTFCYKMCETEGNMIFLYLCNFLVPLNMDSECTHLLGWVYFTFHVSNPVSSLIKYFQCTQTG